MLLEVGSVAPDFSLPNQNGEIISLSSLKGKKVILIGFSIYINRSLQCYEGLVQFYPMNY